ncbi:Fimbrillin-A associated anchor protein Mfa1 and Mfa2 [Dysgonomonas macrotermitis]|uniref:Fimbrillin-A associated anchor protein Mfa1 and Mfa2 n=2 Tax=Dysgonomonas macrotermitis TaxID=1346286 RepID=A0A1M4XBK8_9BACT|nr:Fimbrillin-A associated anchor protein Mfa1 and Mfa2 [Dysgonomonas macrotermitis]
MIRGKIEKMKLSCKYILLAGAIALTLLSGCIKDSYEDCISDLNVYFYSKTSCQLDTVYPEQINDITLCVFDENGVLVSHQQKNNIELANGYTEKIQVYNGLYTVLAWSGIDNSYFDVNDLQDGVTKKSDLLFRLKRIQNLASSIQGVKVYYGERPSILVEAKNSKPVSVKVPVNLLEVTNRLTITIEGLAESPDDYEISIESNNGSMNVNGTIAKDDTIKHEAVTTSEAGVLKAEFTLLKLETGYNNTIVIKNKADGTELYRGSLLGTLLLKNPEVNLNCDHDFTIKFTTKDQCSCGTYTIMEIWVNNWLVHSYSTEM